MPPLFSRDQYEHTITPANCFRLKMTCQHEKYPGLVSTFNTRVNSGTVQLRFVTETALKSPFLCVNKSPIRYGFCAGARSFRYSVVIAQDECFGNDRERNTPTPSSFCLSRRCRANHRGLFVNA